LRENLKKISSCAWMQPGLHMRRHSSSRHHAPKDELELGSSTPAKQYSPSTYGPSR
jgi:hypothetical protein